MMDEGTSVVNDAQTGFVPIAIGSGGVIPAALSTSFAFVSFKRVAAGDECPSFPVSPASFGAIRGSGSEVADTVADVFDSTGALEAVVDARFSARRPESTQLCWRMSTFAFGVSCRRDTTMPLFDSLGSVRIVAEMPLFPDADATLVGLTKAACALAFSSRSSTLTLNSDDVGVVSVVILAGVVLISSKA